MRSVDLLTYLRRRHSGTLAQTSGARAGNLPLIDSQPPQSDSRLVERASFTDKSAHGKWCRLEPDSAGRRRGRRAECATARAPARRINRATPLRPGYPVCRRPVGSSRRRGALCSRGGEAVSTRRGCLGRGCFRTAARERLRAATRVRALALTARPQSAVPSPLASFPNGGADRESRFASRLHRRLRRSGVFHALTALPRKDPQSEERKGREEQNSDDDRVGRSPGDSCDNKRDREQSGSGDSPPRNRHRTLHRLEVPGATVLEHSSRSLSITGREPPLAARLKPGIRGWRTTG
jgi:hypothetical protein